MNYIECPEEYHKNDKKLIFLAGGISNCSNWQPQLAEMLRETDLTVLNPRRKHFPPGDIEEEQITWEYNHLEKASGVSFWFPKETLCPITLYELGKQSALSKKIFIGIHPEYAKRRNVEIQTKLIKPDIKIVYSLENLAEQIREWSKKCY